MLVARAGKDACPVVPGMAIGSPWQHWTGSCNTRAVSCNTLSIKPEPLCIPRAHQHSKDSSKRFDDHEIKLETIDWNGVEIVPVRKDFYVEHPSVEERPDEDDDRIRLKHSIMIIEGSEQVPKPVESFVETAFPDWVTNNLRDRFKDPTPIQVQAWPVALRGHDLVGIAETGSGKTMAYIAPMLVHILSQEALKPGEGPVGLVVVPSRELCMQVRHEVEQMVSHAEDADLVCVAISGGGDRAKQDEAVQRRCDIIVATPGRLIEMLNKRSTNLRRATYFVLDEADQLLETGFEDQIRLVLSQIRPDRQILLFSATWPDNIATLARDVCSCRPIHINVGNVTLSACKRIQQMFRHVGDASKLSMLCDVVLDCEKWLKLGQKGLVFCNNKATIPEVLDALQAQGIVCAGFTAGYSQEKRKQTLAKFKEEGSDLSLLVCTQILGRGHDFAKLRYVINFDMPNDIVKYVHQVGRTARAGAYGFSMTLLEDSDLIQPRAGAKEIRDCLMESEQKIPKFITEAATKRGKDRVKARIRERENPGGVNLPSTGSEIDFGAWRGRGRGIRAEYLRRCEGRGAARGLGLICG